MSIDALPHHVPPDVLALASAPDRPVLVHEVAAALGLRPKAADEYLGRLARANALARRGPGIFTRPREGRPRLELTPLLRRAHTIIRSELPFTPVVGWSTEWLAPYAHNVPLRHWTILEAASPILPTLADVLARDRLRAVVDPPPADVPDLLRLFDRPLVLFPNGETYGADSREGVRLPSPERLVVDFYLAVTRRGIPYPKGDVAKVITALVARRDLNVGSMLAYASRRRAAEDLALYLRALDGFPPDVARAVRLVTERRASRGPRLGGA